MSIHISQTLRQALRIDAIVCALFAVGAFVVLIGSGSILKQLDVPAELLFAAAIVALLGVPAFLWLSHRTRVSEVSVWIILMTNAAWAIASGLALILGWVHASALGAIIIALQGVLVGMIAVLEYIGLRDSRATRG